jgi:predicted nucleotidyltransferase
MKTIREWKNGDKKDEAILHEIRAAVKEVDSSADVILYGSRARDDAGSESDYDLLILNDGPVTLKQEDIFRSRLYPIEIETGAVLTVFLIDRANWNSALYQAMPFYQHVERDGIIL